MARALFFLVLAFALFASCLTTAKVVKFTFNVKNVTVKKLCQKRVITAVNGVSPGPLLKVREGDSLVVKTVNKSPYNITIHW
ncbi:Laccase-7-like protein [Drosera capensis]